MKLITSGVTLSAAIVRSPSFSRSSSSTTMIMRPSRNAETASSIEANGPLAFVLVTFVPLSVFPFARFGGDLDGAQHVLAEHVAFEVDRIVDLQRPEVGVLPRERNDLDVEAPIVH